MRITVAVCTYNRFDWLGKCLESLQKQTIPNEEYRVLVVDNSLHLENSNAFRNTLKGNSNLDYIITDRSGLSYARNVALKKCETPYIAYIDDDAIAAPEWLESILNTFQNYPGAGMVGGKVKPIWEKSKPNWLSEDFLNSLAVIDWGDKDCFIDTYANKWLVGANTAFRASALQAVGGFSTVLGRIGALLLCHEELAVSQAIQRLGYDIVYSPTIQVDHLIQAIRMTKKWLYQDAYWEGVSRVLLENNQTAIDTKALTRQLGNAITGMIEHMGTAQTPKAILEETRRFGKEGRRQCNKFLRIKAKKLSSQMIDNWPVIYIVTPSLNSVETINRAILSIVTQAGNFSIRYHIQDGGSRDGTLEKLKSWEERLSEPNPFILCKNVVFTYSSENDKGMYDAISRGFASMHIPANAFITWLNADDILMQNAFAMIMSISQQVADAHWLGGSVSVNDEDGQFIYQYPLGFPTEVIREGICDGFNWRTLQQEGCFWRKWLWDKVGGVNTELKYAGDWDLWRRFAQYVEFIQIPWTLGIFHARKGQLSALDGGAGYKKELNSLLSPRSRLSALKQFALKGRRGLAITELGVNFISKKYFVKRSPIGYRIPHQAEGFFRDKGKPADGVDIESPFDRAFSPILPKRTFFNSALVIKIYSISPHFLQRILRWSKHRIIIRIMNFLKKWKVYIVIQRSGLFYASYYLKMYPDVAEKGINPTVDYINSGSREGRSPNPLFDSQWYLKKYPDVADQGINPLFHFIKYGEKEGRDPSPRFFTRNYRELNPDAGEAVINSLQHYLKYGAFEGIPIINEDTRFYGTIYDLGLHTGEDTIFYLKKGFRVIAVDANPELVDEAKIEFRQYVADKQLILLNLGIVENPTQRKHKFYINENHTEWSSFVKEIAVRDGGPYKYAEVDCATVEEIISDHGKPYFVKIDIEGHEYMALKSLLCVQDLPKYVSVENGDIRMLDLLYESGYCFFKYIQQNNIQEVLLPNPPREGDWVDHTFPFGSSGPFGEETMGEWMEYKEIRPVIENIRGPDGNRKNPEHDDSIHGWFDLHAKLF